MIEAKTEPHFLNRSGERELLEALAKSAVHGSAFVILRSPPGFGKSELTNEFLARQAPGLFISAIIDPLIRPSAGDSRVYEGYFVQRCADALSDAMELQSKAPSFAKFLQERRWDNVREKDVYEAVRVSPSFDSAFSTVVDYAERFFSFGKRHPKQVLKSDASDAIAACREYVELVCRSEPTLIIVREAQAMDHESMRAILAASRLRNGSMLIFEYTSTNYCFEPDHQKILERELIGHGNARIHNLLRLERGYFEQLLRRLPDGCIDVEGEFYARWDGNLRVLNELKYQVTIGNSIKSAADLADRVGDIGLQVERHVGELPARQRLLLALVAANVEPIARRTLFIAAARAAPEAAEADLVSDLEALRDRHGFLVTSGESVSIENAEVARAIRVARGGLGAIALAERVLRDVYIDLIRERDFAHVAMAGAARAAFRLCARTQDIALLMQLTDEISEQMRAAHDQTVYVDVVVETISTQTDLLPAERNRLIDWAGSLAYEICDFAKARLLFEAMPNRMIKHDVLLAHCYMEEAQHAKALELSMHIRSHATHNEATIAAGLIDAGVALDSGNWDEGRRLLGELISTEGTEHVPMIGHALRLLSEMQEYPECTQTAIRSVEWFARLGLERSRAYSALSASRFLARTGRSPEAIALIELAEACLRGHVRNEHLVLNNKALVHMLAPAPDYDQCAEWLRQALRTSRYDFGDLSILSNLAVAHWKRNDLDSAAECVARCQKILLAPDFAERDVYWPVCFNLAQILNALDRPDEAAKVAAMPAQTGWTTRSNDAYWAYRYGETEIPDPSLAYLMRYDYHPVALSHWNLDVDCLSRLT